MILKNLEVMGVYRKIMKSLEAWQKSEYRKPLVLQGARQVGKTFSLLLKYRSV